MSILPSGVQRRRPTRGPLSCVTWTRLDRKSTRLNSSHLPNPTLFRSEDLLPVIAGRIEDEHLAVGGPAKAANARPLELRDLDAISTVGIADEDLVGAALIADVGDSRAVGRPRWVDLAAGGADHGVLFDGIAGGQRGAPDGADGGTVGVSQSIASDGGIVSLMA